MSAMILMGSNGTGLIHEVVPIVHMLILRACWRTLLQTLQSDKYSSCISDSLSFVVNHHSIYDLSIVKLPLLTTAVVVHGTNHSVSG